MNFYPAYILAKFQTIKNIEAILILQKSPNYEILSRPLAKLQTIKNFGIVRILQKS